MTTTLPCSALSARRLLPTLLATLSLYAAGAAAQTPPPPAAAQALYPLIAQRSQAIEQQVIAWRRDIHEHPELGNQEQRTAA
ncbi:MAG TPA: hypothetical protein VMS38_32460, partial [Pseudorhodoferax sp.]|nr:hypothetical protein [Pseudorhodoferax sp.]